MAHSMPVRHWTCLPENAGTTKIEAAKYTRKRRAVKVVYFETFDTLRAARRHEAEVKRWSKAHKEAIVRRWSRRAGFFCGECSRVVDLIRFQGQAGDVANV